jgi:hypothetical protein
VNKRVPENKLKIKIMKKLIFVVFVLAILLTTCSKENKIDDPQILEFSAYPTTLPKKDTVTFNIDAIGDNITFYDGKSIVSLDEEDLPLVYKIDKLRFRVTAPADTIYAYLTVVNIYDIDVIKEVTDSIELILLDE